MHVELKFTKTTFYKIKFSDKYNLFYIIFLAIYHDYYTVKKFFSYVLNYKQNLTFYACVETETKSFNSIGKKT